MSNFHFISGLPRSGSTLLSALLRQNPRFYAGMSSPAGALVSANLKLMSSGGEVGLMVDTQQRKRILAGLFHSCYGHREEDIVFDTNRMWCAKMPLVSEMFPEAKLIACVRDIPWIMDSIERLIQKNPFENTKLFSGESERATIYSRMAALARHDRLIGFPWAALKEAYYGEHSKKLLIVEYELLARAPEKILKIIYQFIDEPWFEGHDYQNVEFDAPDFDEALGVQGMHRVRKTVSPIDRQSILPPDIFEKYDGMAFWRDDARTLASVIKPTKH